MTHWHVTTAYGVSPGVTARVRATARIGGGGGGGSWGVVGVVDNQAALV